MKKTDNFFKKFPFYDRLEKIIASENKGDIISSKDKSIGNRTCKIDHITSGNILL